MECTTGDSKLDVREEDGPPVPLQEVPPRGRPSTGLAGRRHRYHSLRRPRTGFHKHRACVYGPRGPAARRDNDKISPVLVFSATGESYDRKTRHDLAMAGSLPVELTDGAGLRLKVGFCSCVLDPCLYRSCYSRDGWLRDLILVPGRAFTAHQRPALTGKTFGCAGARAGREPVLTVTAQPRGDEHEKRTPQ